MSEKNAEIVEKVNKGFEENKPEVFLSYCTDDVVWRMVGDRDFNGKEAIKEFMASMEGMEPPKFNVKEIIASGDSVACYGDMTMKDEGGKEGTYSFVDVYGFAKGKIARLQTFIVKHKTEEEASSKAA